MIIKINVTDKHAVAVGDPSIVCGNGDYSVEFTFDEEWGDFDAKTARFVYYKGGRVRNTDVVFTGNTVQVPKLSNVQNVAVGVFAGDLHTTTPALIPCELSIRCGTGAPEDPTPSQYDQIMALLRLQGGGLPARIAEVSLPAAGWVGDASLFSQVVDIAGITAYSQVDLTPSVEQLAIFYEKDLGFVTENENGIVTVYAIGQKPQNDYVIQATITEVIV